MRRGDRLSRCTLRQNNSSSISLLSSTFQISQHQPLPSAMKNAKFAACSLFPFPKQHAGMVDENLFWETLPILFPQNTSCILQRNPRRFFSWELCPENKCAVGVVKVLQRAQRWFSEWTRRWGTGRHGWRSRERSGEGRKMRLGGGLVPLRRGKEADSSGLHFLNFNHLFSIFMVFVKLPTSNIYLMFFLSKSVFFLT